MPDLEVLRVIWWLLLGVLLIGFALTDGFDFGVAALLPFVTRTDLERRVVINSIGPFWEGNQVWIILGAGAIFAAWPYVYAVAFSSFYLLLLLLLLTMGIARPVSIKYRSKLASIFWRQFWDMIFILGGVVPAVIFGLLIGNALTGVAFSFDQTLRIFPTVSFIDAFSPFACLCGLCSLSMLMMHGGLYLAMKTDDPIRSRAIRCARISALCLMALFALGGLWVANGLFGYQVTGGADPVGYSNPLHKQVIHTLGAWMHNYYAYPQTMGVPTMAFVAICGVLLTASKRNSGFAFLCSCLSIAAIIATVGVSMFPFILPSSTHFTSSLLVWDASSSYLTLLVMLGSVIFFMPIILLYTAWVYRVMRGKVIGSDIEENRQHVAY